MTQISPKSDHRVSRVSLCANVAAQIEQKRAGRRQRVFHGGTLCGKCLANPPIGNGQRYCRECHNAAARESMRRSRAAAHELAAGR